MSAAHRAPTSPADTRRSRDEKSTPSVVPSAEPPPSARPGPPPSAPREPSPRHAISVSPPLSPEAGNTSRTTSEPKSCTDYCVDLPRTLPRTHDPPRRHPCLPRPSYMPPTQAASVSRTTCSSDLTCSLFVLPEPSSWLLARTNLDEPTPSLQPHYRIFITTTSRSASGFRNGTQHLAISVAQRSPSHHPKTGRGIGTRLPKFHVRAAEQDHATSVPDTAWPINGTPARLVPGSHWSPRF